MSPSSLWLRLRAPRVWHDPVRKVLTLESFSQTEEDGGRDISAAARRADDPELRLHLERHAQDEVRHADLFRRRAAELRAAAHLGSASGDHGKMWDMARGRRSAEKNLHGFFNASVLDERGDIPYVAMLHVAELRARDLFEVHHDLTRDDPETCAVFEQILKDEKYHVAYTGNLLKKYRAEGRSREVRRALRASRSSRLWSAWKALGVRSGASFSRAVLWLFYWTLLLPFGLIARGRRERDQDGAGETRVVGAAAADLRSQY